MIKWKQEKRDGKIVQYTYEHLSAIHTLSSYLFVIDVGYHLTIWNLKGTMPLVDMPCVNRRHAYALASSMLEHIRFSEHNGRTL